MTASSDETLRAPRIDNAGAGGSIDGSIAAVPTSRAGNRDVPTVDVGPAGDTATRLLARGDWRITHKVAIRIAASPDEPARETSLPHATADHAYRGLRDGWRRRVDRPALAMDGTDRQQVAPP